MAGGLQGLASPSPAPCPSQGQLTGQPVYAYTIKAPDDWPCQLGNGAAQA